MKIALLLLFFVLGNFASLADEQATLPERLFVNKLLALWPSAMNIEKLSPRSINNGVPLVSPPLTWLNILRVEGIDFEGKGYAHCLYYLIPHHSDKSGLEQPGLLKVVSVDMEENCQDKFVRQSFAFLTGVEQLYVYLTYPGAMDNQGRDLPANQLILKFFYSGKELEWHIPVYNIATGFLKSPTSPRLLQQWDLRAVYTQAPRYRPGVQLGPLLNNGKVLDAKALWHGSTLSKTESMCLVLDDQCQPKGPDVCHRCASFSLSANAFGCTSAFHRFCGIGKCGEREMPACPRGQHYLSTELDESGVPDKLISGVCSAGFKSGICRPGLQPFCNENGVQICL